MSDVVIEIAETRLKGYTDNQTAILCDVPIEWVRSDTVQETIKILKGLNQGPFRFSKKY